MSIELLEQAAAALGQLREEVIFVGGATLALWITDPGAPEVRPTYDVDVVAEVTSRREYYKFEARLREAGFRDEGDPPVRSYVRESLLEIFRDEFAVEGVYAHLRPDAASQARAHSVVLPRIAALTGKSW